MKRVASADNPKDLIGSHKLPLHLWPETATVLGCLAMLDGALQYGRGNFRMAKVRFTIYYDALRRHMNSVIEGEWIDPKSGLPHMAHALACCAIIVDAWAAGSLIDDRHVAGGYLGLVQRMTPHVRRLQRKHKGRTPTHYTIKEMTT